MKRKGLILSIIWLIIMTGEFIYINCTLKYPTTDTLEDMVGLFVIFLIPIFFVVYYSLSQEKRKKLLEISFIVLFILSVMYSYFAFVSITFYPVNISETKDYNNYLDLDYVSENVDRVINIFPKEIPEKATDINYHYKAAPDKNAMFVEAYWIVPQEEYAEEKKRIQGVSSNYMKLNDSEYYYVDIGEDYCHVRFYEKDKSITYFADLNNYCDWQYISWIKCEWEE